MHSTSTATRQVPRTILGKLRTVRRTQWRVQMVTGWLKIVTAFVVLMALALAIDALFVLFAPAVRWGLTVTTLILAAVPLISWGILPLWKRLQLGRLARTVDEAVPELQERWSTVTGLRQSRDDAGMLGAPELIDRVCDEAEALAPRVTVRKVVSRRRLGRAMAVVANYTRPGRALLHLG